MHQQGITGSVTIGVVDLLEPVQINNQQGMNG